MLPLYSKSQEETKPRTRQYKRWTKNARNHRLHSIPHLTPQPFYPIISPKELSSKPEGTLQGPCNSTEKQAPFLFFHSQNCTSQPHPAAFFPNPQDFITAAILMIFPLQCQSIPIIQSLILPFVHWPTLAAQWPKDFVQYIQLFSYKI